MLAGYGLHKGKGLLYLVYDLMRSGNLHERLYVEAGSPVLSWDERNNILKDAALGLYQLHVSNAFHGSVKASNIMLEPGLYGRRARLGDFTYSMVEPRSEEAAPTSTGSATTTSSTLTLESDVLNFGTVILEVVCGRRSCIEDAPIDSRFLVDWVWALHGEGRLLEAVDARLDGHFDKLQAVNLLLVGLACSHPTPELRPAICDVRMVLAEKALPPEVPSSKPI